MIPQGFPNRLVILGGGTAGWMCAAFLDRTYNVPGRKRLDIALVESPAIGRIGVGEATIPSLARFCEFVGIEEAMLMQRTNATFKHGIAFEGWNGPDTRYFHAFEALERLRGINFGPIWLARKGRGIAGAFDDEMGIQKRVADAGLAPKHMMHANYVSALPYAYHLDAEAFGDLLAEIATARGVEHIVGDVTHFTQTGEGDVTALHLGDGRAVEGDFFVDCSGFRQMLIGEALGTPFVSFADHLLCDRAIAMPVARAEGEAIPPFTRAIAEDAGWRWRIGLQSREGTGYVYSSQFLDDDAAEAALRAANGAPPETEARRLKMRVGRPEVSWARNVVAIGLAGGFVEPLESTSIQMVEFALEMLVRYFPLSGINPAARDRFNAILNDRQAEIHDFIVMHYCLSKRRDTPFWREATRDARIPESLAARLEIWSDRHPAVQEIGREHPLFSHTSWQNILYGMDGAQPRAIANAKQWVEDVTSYAEQSARAGEAALADLPSHMIWLEGLRSVTVNHSGW